MLQNTQTAVGGGGLHVREKISNERLTPRFEEIICVENLLLAWQEFKSGKAKKQDVQEFQLRLMDNILALHKQLANKTYRHGPYYHFRISDPKPRDIHKALVRDRLVHHAIYRVLYPYFSRRFIADSYSCQLGKGTHKAMDRFTQFAARVSRNHTRTTWVLKCDIRKFFASIDHAVLFGILRRHIQDVNTLWLLESVVGSFRSPSVIRSDPGFESGPGLPREYPRNDRGESRVGLPLGNLTSQLLVNIYMNEFDQFVKHELRETYYIRYADDFVFLADNREELESLIEPISQFLQSRLGLELHPDKLFLKTIASSIDFLGWVHFPDHRVLRTASKKRMIRRLQVNENNEARLNSYRGLLRHGNARKLQSRYLGIDSSDSQ